MQSQPTGKAAADKGLGFHAIMAFIVGAGMIGYCAYYGQGLPKSGKNLGPAAMEDLLICYKTLLFQVIPGLSVYLMLLSFVIWRRLRKMRSAHQSQSRHPGERASHEY